MVLFSDIFSQISDSNGLLLQWRFNEYLQEVLALPAAVYESPTFNYTDTLANSIFSPVSERKVLLFVINIIFIFSRIQKLQSMTS